MSDPCDAYQVLMSGYLDGELDEVSEKELEEHTLQCSACRREFESMKRLVQGTTRALVIEEPPAEVWDAFLDSVYNRMERKIGWVLLCFGAFAVAGVALWEFIYYPWAPLLVKFMFAVPAGGASVLFVSVLRQRLRILRTDRYTREVHR
ncbi:MAG: zf-HC2 domain-containing protein [Candidatus Hydrogenedentes bacterium]|nr:zf-HC2 domain-containing protein [Candidatus Hydrogenedentota bacterium]